MIKVVNVRCSMFGGRSKCSEAAAAAAGSSPSRPPPYSSRLITLLKQLFLYPSPAPAPLPPSTTERGSTRRRIGFPTACTRLSRMPATILLRFGGGWGAPSLACVDAEVGVEVEDVDEAVEGGEGDRLRLVRE